MKNKYFVFMPVIYKSQTIDFVLHTLLARAHILVTCLVAFATTVAFFFFTPLLATILSCRSLPNWPGIQHHHSHRHRKEDEEQDVEAVRKRNQKVISTLAVYFSSILLLVV